MQAHNNSSLLRCSGILRRGPSVIFRKVTERVDSEHQPSRWLGISGFPKLRRRRAVSAAANLGTGCDASLPTSPIARALLHNALPVATVLRTPSGAKSLRRAHPTASWFRPGRACGSSEHVQERSDGRTQSVPGHRSAHQGGPDGHRGRRKGVASLYLGQSRFRPTGPCAGPPVRSTIQASECSAQWLRPPLNFGQVDGPDGPSIDWCAVVNANDRSDAVVASGPARLPLCSRALLV